MALDFSLAQFLGRNAPTIDIVDVGAMSLGGQPDYHPLLKSGVARVIGFEPVQAECDKLNAMAGKNHKYLPHFIGDGTERTFHLCNMSMTSSLYEPDSAFLSRFTQLEELTRVVSKEQVKTRRLDDIPEITNIDLLKIDIQGAELDAFKGAQRLLKDAVCVYTEVEFLPMYKNQPLFAEVDAHLRGLGFLLHTFPDGLSGRTFKPVQSVQGPYQPLRQIIWADAIYVKHFMHLEQLSPEKLLKLAIIAHDLCKSYDLVNLVLRVYDKVTGKSLWKPYMTRITGGDPGAPPAYID
ncbi:MAG: FkbM family methyltransferase [Planctomycetes bacterium]|nr:FkbM family methyltransferase [Planctomycetota bacterium]